MKKRENKNDSKLQEQVIEAPPKYPYNLSFDFSDTGVLLQPDGHLVSGGIIGVLLDRLDEALMEKRVEKEYRAYGVGATLQTMVNAINIDHITNDKGDASAADE